jgi:UDP-N-acetylglucosamine 4,6-dehydratase
MIKDKNILITSTGTWANELIKQLLELEPASITAFSRNEFMNVTRQREWAKDKRVKIVIGDVKDFNTVDKLSRNADIVYHAAALKHVTIAENNPMEAVRTNIEGTANVIEAAAKNMLDKVIFVSTDKAVSANNVYGATKFIAERMIMEANLTHFGTQFINTRAGNVMNSAGSVIPIFIEQAKENGKITITDLSMTRFLMSLKEAVSMLIVASQVGHGGETIVTRMKKASIVDLAHVIYNNYNYRNEWIDKEEFLSQRVNIIGRKPGEKIHEMLVSEHEALDTYCLGNKHYLILPSLLPDIRQHWQNKLIKSDIADYTSADDLMTYDEIENMLESIGVMYQNGR